LGTALSCFTGLRFTTGWDRAIGLRLAGASAFLTAANCRLGLRLAPGAADRVLLADDARFMNDRAGRLRRTFWSRNGNSPARWASTKGDDDFATGNSPV